MNVFSSINRQPRKLIAPAAGAATVGLMIAALAATPAEARVLDTDHPRVTASNHDFGKNWVVSAPQSGGKLTWDLTDGVTTASLSGYHYLSGRHCGRVYVQYYNDDHVQIGTDSSASKCAPGSGKTQWWITESFSSTTVTHVHVSVQHKNSNGSYSTIETDTEDFD